MSYDDWKWQFIDSGNIVYVFFGLICDLVGMYLVSSNSTRGLTFQHHAEEELNLTAEHNYGKIPSGFQTIKNQKKNGKVLKSMFSWMSYTLHAHKYAENPKFEKNDVAATWVKC